MSRAGRIIREPLVHFIALGAALFAMFSALAPSSANAPSGKTIVVDKPALLNFMQYRSKAFEADYFTRELESMSEDERAELVNQYLQEEMLYREAQSLGLEQGDYVIRQRLVQKMRFLIDDLAETAPAPDDQTLESYLRKHEARYVVEPAVTFTHVFVDASTRDDKEAGALARRLQAQLQSTGATFNDAPRFGDRFPFFENYVERTLDYVATHFGADFAAELKRVDPSASRWNGPIRSNYGYHLVLLTHRSESRLPDLTEIRQEVQDDWNRDRLENVRVEAMRRLSATYRVERHDLPGKTAK
jgi:parvulin-like peptidyl-prolyl isomerase